LEVCAALRHENDCVLYLNLRVNKDATGLLHALRAVTWIASCYLLHQHVISWLMHGEFPTVSVPDNGKLLAHNIIAVILIINKHTQLPRLLHDDDDDVSPWLFLGDCLLLCSFCYRQSIVILLVSRYIVKCYRKNRPTLLSISF